MAQAQQLPTSWQDLVGRLLEERYRLDAVIAEGGMSVIFKGHHLRLNRDVALKILKPELEDGGRQFLREAENAARLNHPNCITVYDFGTASSGLNYMVMPLLQGEPLSKRVGVRMPPREVARLGIELLRGLEHAHDQGIIHRDLKPENLFLATEADGSQVLKIVDFGIAKLKSPDPGTMNATMSGLMSGTPTYMSPEQALGQETDERTDLYSVGVIFYTLLVGHPPFNEDDAIVVLRMHINGEMPPLPEDVPEEMARIVNRLIQKERKNRFSTANEVLLELESYLAETSSPMSGVGAVPQIASPFGDHSVPPLPAVSTLDAIDDDVLVEPPRVRKLFVLSLGALIAAGVGFAVMKQQTPEVAVAPEAPPAVVVAAPPPTVDAEDAAGLVRELNDTRRASKMSYEERHDKLAQVDAAGLRDELNARMHLRLDLEQSLASTTPCTAFRTALEAIRDDGADGWRRELAGVKTVPQPGAPKHAGRAPDGGCDGLPELLAAIRGDAKPDDAAVDVTIEDEPPPPPKPQPRSRNKRSERSQKAAKTKPPAPQPVETKKPEPASTPIEAPPAAAPPPAEPALVVPKLSDGVRRL